MAPSGPDELRSADRTPSVSPAAREDGEAGSLTVIELPDGYFYRDVPAIKPRDFLTLATLPPSALLAWSCSDRLCLALSRAASRLLQRLRPGRYADFERIFRDFLPDGMQPETRLALAVETAALLHLERFQLLRYHRPGSWRPRIEVAGKAHLERALARGKGAILWVAFSTFSDMIAKVALRGLGYDVWHLSRHTHGHMSSSRFGIRYLNPIRTSLESRYLASRVIIDPADPRAAVARLERLLADNQVVSITVAAAARKVALVPFGPGTLPLAGGAPNLAVKSGAALLPLFAERRPDGSFLVTIEPPLEAPEGTSRGEKIAALLTAQGALMWRHFQRLPTQCHFHDLYYFRERWLTVGEGQSGVASQNKPKASGGAGPEVQPAPDRE